MRRRDLLACALAGFAVPLPLVNHRRTDMRIRPINPADNAFAEASEVSDANRILFISGQVPARPDGSVPQDYPSQYRLAWANIDRQLRAADMTFDNLVKVTIFLSDRGLIAQSAGLRQEVLGTSAPAVTIIIAGIYDESWLLEIEAVAAA